MKRTIIMIATFLGGLYFFAEFFLPKELGLTNVYESYTNMLMVVGVMAIGVGAINLIHFHATNVIRKRKGWYNSVGLILAALLMFIFQLWEYYNKDYVLFGATVVSIRDFLFNNLLIPLETTTFSLLAFFIASASYRAFRVKSFEASIMMVVAFIVMLGQIPLGQQLAASLANTPLQGFDFKSLRDWIMSVWNVAAQRAITFGAVVGSLALGLRVWLGLEQGSFFEETE